jgi:hypothetical protein
MLNGISVSPTSDVHMDAIFILLWSDMYLGILHPWAQENFAPPPPPFVRIQLCGSKNNKKLTKDKTL